MSLAAPSLQLVSTILSTHSGTSVRVTTIEPVYGSTVFRCTLDRAATGLGTSVIVKRARAAGASRSDAAMMRNEVTALRFLTENGLRFGPRFITSDETERLVIMEDLGDGDTLEDVLFGDDRQAAIDGLVAFGQALGELHAATAGRAGAFLTARNRRAPDQTTWEPAGAFDLSFRSSWEELRKSVAAHPELPQATDVEPEIDAMLRTLAPAGPYLAMTNGDPCPANTRFANGSLRFLDFEHGTFRHALLDLTALLLPFPACPCWSLLPDEAAAPAIRAWRGAFAKHHPDVLDDYEYLSGAAAACLAWAILRLRAWTRLDKADEPHPVGFSKRAQRLATIDAAVRVAQGSGTLPALTAWFVAFSSALRGRWSGGPLTITIFPAFSAARPDLPPGALPPVPDGRGGIRIRAGSIT